MLFSLLRPFCAILSTVLPYSVLLLWLSFSVPLEMDQFSNQSVARRRRTARFSRLCSGRPLVALRASSGLFFRCAPIVSSCPPFPVSSSSCPRLVLWLVLPLCSGRPPVVLPFSSCRLVVLQLLIILFFRRTAAENGKVFPVVLRSPFRCPPCLLWLVLPLCPDRL